MQNELFPQAQIEKPRSCRQCRHHFEDPYDRCSAKENCLLVSLNICNKFRFKSEKTRLITSLPGRRTHNNVHKQGRAIIKGQAVCKEGL